MNRYRIYILALGFTLAIASPSLAQRGRGGGFGGGGGGGISRARPAAPAARPSGFTAPARPSTPRPATTSAGHANHSSNGSHSSGVGPNGGSWQAGKGGGSYTTKGGATIEYKGAAWGGTGPGGVSGGRYVGGVQVTTPGGQTINHVGRGGAVTGPGGNTAGGRSGISSTNGPAGSGATASRSGFVTGPNGAVAGRSGVAVGPNGIYAGRSGVAVGPNGVVAGRSGVAVTSHGTYYHSAVAIGGQGVYVRAGCVHYHNCFTRGWYVRYPGAWFATGLVAGAAWNAATYAEISSSGGYPADPQAYDYGSNVVYEGGQVYANGDPVGTTSEYVEQATAIADAGKPKDPAQEKDGDWIPLGVFAMVRGEETTSDNLFQLAVNKDGLLRGNYYNAIADTTTPIYGSVDKKTQRVAWTVGNKQTPIYEAGIVNLTTDSTTMMVHYSKEKSQQFSLFRIDKTDADEEVEKPAPAKE